VKTAAEIRSEFLTFFEEKGHTIVPSDSLVPGSDPTLMFTNAGMNQFKDVFLGEGERSYKRAVDSQKCLRVSGKHNDLEEVGYDTYHHTFFEMLGNWSFGDYFKREAVRWAWELLVDTWGLDPDRLYASVHDGDEALGLEADLEAAACWKEETTIPHDHILFCGSKDNFWMMGDTGPCGPCSEIHVDMRLDSERADVPGRDLVNADHPQVIEIWNLVFIQYNAHRDGRLVPLAAKHVDTGMGFERMVAVLQGRKSNYDTDLFMPILDDIAARTDMEDLRRYDDALNLPSEQGERIRTALRVMADHARTIAFAIADGVIPGNAGRAYVIRRILRRAVRYGYQALGFRKPVLADVILTVVDLMGEQFPELVDKKDYIVRVVASEEKGFLETLGTGIQLFETLLPHIRSVSEGGSTGDDRAVRDLLEKSMPDAESEKERMALFESTASRGLIPGPFAFLLHDTFGFPIDLTALMAREAGFGVDMEGYTACMDRQKSRARAASSFKVDQSGEDGWQQVSEGPTSVFTGYDTLVVEDATIRAVQTIEDADEDGAAYRVLLDRTPFYAESGGQVGDTGTFTVGTQLIDVLDTQRMNGQIAHMLREVPQDLTTRVVARVDGPRRHRAAKHHSATHLLHAALRDVLGSHVEQKGSLVAPDYMRFDFSHFERVSDEDLREVEVRVNEAIQRNISLSEDRDVPMKEAMERGATALFGEKYGERVRIISFDPDWSMELCGGTHVAATGEIGQFWITSEGSVAAGIRRIEAVAGMDAHRWVQSRLDELDRTRALFKSLQNPVDEEVEKLLLAGRERERELQEMRQRVLAAQSSRLLESARPVGDMHLVTGILEGADMDALRSATEALRERAGDDYVLVLGSRADDEGKVYLCASVADNLVGRGLAAGKIVGALAKHVGGGGGGRPTIATAGGKKPENLQNALDAVESLIRR